MLVGADPVFATWRDQLITLAARYAIPTIFELREFVAAGGLMSYGPSLSDAYRLVGLNTGQILKGAKACGPAGPAADQVRVGDQSQDCEGAWHQRAADAARARRRGD